MAKKNKKDRYGYDTQNLDEMFRQLRTNIEFSEVDDKLKIINVVSTFPNEGKSTISLNLAKIFADKYKNVLLIDCDLRNPSLHKMLQTTNAIGLTNLLPDFNANTQIAACSEVQSIAIDGKPQLYFLSTGTKVPNPSEILNSRRFAAFMKAAKEQFAVVIVDCPPAFSVSDAVPVSNVSDGTLFVLSAKETDKYAAKEVLTDLERNGANVIGIVMTKVDTHNSKYYGNKYGYGYGYGYGNTSENK